MKIGVIVKLQTRLLRRRNQAQHALALQHRGPLNMHRVRLDAEVTTLDKVLDDVDRLIARNHDRFHERRRKNL